MQLTYLTFTAELLSMFEELRDFAVSFILTTGLTFESILPTDRFLDFLLWVKVNRRLEQFVLFEDDALGITLVND